MIGKLEITSNIPEINFMESVLNMASSGYEGSCSVSLIFYALIHSMNIDDFVYYNCLIEKTKKTYNTTLVTKEKGE